jgi:hypothetical protein
MIQNPLGTGRVQYFGPPVVLSPLETRIAYVGILIPVIVGLFVCLDLFFRKRRSSGYSLFWLRFFGIAFLVLGLVTILGLRAFVQANDVTYRFVTFLYIFLAPVSALGFNVVQIRLNLLSLKVGRIRTIWRSLGRGIFVIFFLAVPVLSTGLLISGSLGKPVMTADGDVVVLSSWLTSHNDRSSAIIGETSLAEPIAAYSRLEFWPENISSNETITDVLYYGGNMSALIDFFNQNKGEILFIVDKHFVDQEHYHLRIDTRTRIPSPEATSFAFWTLDQLPILNKVYDGESPSVFIATNR